MLCFFHLAWQYWQKMIKPLLPKDAEKRSKAKDLVACIYRWISTWSVVLKMEAKYDKSYKKLETFLKDERVLSILGLQLLDKISSMISNLQFTAQRGQVCQLCASPPSLLHGCTYNFSC